MIGRATTAATLERTEPTIIRQNRREHRVDTNWLGWIRLRDGVGLPCVVRDVSMSGARLSVPLGVSLARTFILEIEEPGFAFAVSLVWRRGSSAGVRLDRMARLDTYTTCMT